LRDLRRIQELADIALDSHAELAKIQQNGAGASETSAVSEFLRAQPLSHISDPAKWLRPCVAELHSAALRASTVNDEEKKQPVEQNAVDDGDFDELSLPRLDKTFLATSGASQALKLGKRKMDDRKRQERAVSDMLEDSRRKRARIIAGEISDDEEDPEAESAAFGARRAHRDRAAIAAEKPSSQNAVPMQAS
jgi:hypothetical protein